MFYLIITSFLFTIVSAFSQGNAQQSQSDKFYFDAVLFKGDSINRYRVDNYIVFPYENMNFIYTNDIYIAKYTIQISAKDSSGNIIKTENIERTISEKDYYIAHGANADFDKLVVKLYLEPGKYIIEANIKDQNSIAEYSKQREINVIDFRSFNFAMSGILLLSSIEEENGKYKITPHISDNIANLTNGFFIFFESYNQNSKYDSIDYVWEIYDTKNELIAYSNRNRKPNTLAKSQNFIRIPPIKEMTTGSYTISLLALEPLNINEYSKESAIARTNRSIKYLKTFANGNIMEDLNLAIRQLRYVASRDEMDNIQSAKDEKEKQKRFEEFWKKLDPTPYTERNEAFDDYYSRINYANQNFKGLQDGWLTDMGMVYIIFGEPTSRESQFGYGDNKTYQRWLYGNGREFIFVDNTGFKDYRLLRPAIITEKYKYNK